MAGRLLHVHVVEARGLPSCRKMFGGEKDVYVAVELDGKQHCKSGAVHAHPQATWNWQTQLHVPAGTAQLCFWVKKPGIVSSTSVAGCSLHLDALPDQCTDLSLYMPGDSTEGGGGTLRVLVRWADCIGGVHQGGLANHAAARTLGGSCSRVEHNPVILSEEPPSGSFLTNRASGSSFAGHGAPGGLLNHAASSSSSSGVHGGLVNYVSPRLSSSHGLSNVASEGLSAPTSGSVGLANSVAGAGSFGGSGTSSLANMAEAGDDGTRQNALPRAQELLSDLEDSSLEPGSELHRRKVQQVLENLRCTGRTVLQSDDGQAAMLSCSGHIEAIFERSLASGNERERQAALWLAGRLPDSDKENSLQETLRHQWDASKMDEAYDKAEVMLVEAGQSTAGLEGFMDSLELAEFHANQAHQDNRPRSESLLEQLKPSLGDRLHNLLRIGALGDLETALLIIGNARIHSLGLRDVQQALERLRSLELLRNALLPVPGQVGFPELKTRATRNAVMNMQTALSDDPDGEAVDALRVTMYEGLFLPCFTHSDESAQAVINAAFKLHLPEAEVWSAAERVFESSVAQRQSELCTFIPEFCQSLSQPIPAWMLDRLRALYRLPENWDVASMAQSGARKLLAKTPVQDPRLLALFDNLLKTTAQPHIRTRDRRGSAPKAFAAVRAVQIMNATNWQTYVQRRDEIANECRTLNVGHDPLHWQQNWNGEVASMFIKDAMRAHVTEPLLSEANEMWLLHGTSPAAAEGITTEDFDMTRANPMGLFGGGVYFGESISKADEYVEGVVEGGQELFPLLLCRVCLGNVYYCDSRTPDKAGLLDRCLRKQWHSVLGDRLKTSGTFREFIVYDNFQAFPAYIIYYTRQY